MGEPQVEELEAVAWLASPEREDQLGLVVRFANRPRFAMVEGLPAHCLRVGEPQPLAVEVEHARRAPDAYLLEHVARNDLGLEARLGFDLRPVEIRERCASGRRAARLEVRPARIAQEDVFRVIGLYVRLPPSASVTCP